MGSIKLLSAWVLAASLVAAGGQDRKPNIVLIVADDLGWGELGCQGSKDIATPHIDSIAKNGLRFTNGYVSCPVCSPTRAGLLSGRYQQRFGHEFNPGPAGQADPKFGLPLTEVTIANRLKEAGYATGMVGKWHQGYLPAYHPMKRGFDEFFGFLGGAHSYVGNARKGADPILRGTEAVDEKEYLTEAFGRESVAFIDRHKDHPFFLYLPFNAVHAPMDIPDKYKEKLGAIADAKRRTFAAMLVAMDEAVGRVLEKLREAKLEEQTLVLFVSDNGGPTPQTTSGNGPLRGFKGGTFEGGIRVPFMMQWKGKLPAGKTFDAPAIALDLHATALGAAGVPVPEKLDGVNLLPFATGEKTGVPHEALYWRFGPQGACRKGDWKLVIQKGATQLFNLAQDLGEKGDLAAKEPEKLKELQAAYDAWNATLAEPLWKTQRGK